MGKRRRSRNSTPRNWLTGALVICLALAATGLTVLALQTTPANTLSADYTPKPIVTPVDDRPRVAFIGDSYTAGTGSTSTANRWTSLVSRDLEWAELNFGKGGTGYISTSEQCNGPCANYPDTIAEVAAADPDVVIVTGVRNDASIPADQLDPAIAAFFAQLRASIPDADIYAVSPIWDDAVAPARVGAIGEVIRESVTSVGGTYVDIGQPIENQPAFVVEDGVHPSDAGHEAIAAAFISAWGGTNPAT